MMSKHTPGPWSIQRQNPSPTTGEWMVAGKSPGYLAEVRDCGSGPVEANARLIAAAPDLLEALEALITAVDASMYGMAIHNARAAIAKAKGET